MTKPQIFCQYLCVATIAALDLSTSAGAAIPAPVFVEVTVDAGSSPNDDCTEVEYGCFHPGHVIVAQDGPVKFTNTENGLHTFTSGLFRTTMLGVFFFTSLLQNGQFYKARFDEVVWILNSQHITYF